MYHSVHLQQNTFDGNEQFKRIAKATIQHICLDTTFTAVKCPNLLHSFTGCLVLFKKTYLL